jgi:hypothetical protein
MYCRTERQRFHVRRLLQIGAFSYMNTPKLKCRDLRKVTR